MRYVLEKAEVSGSIYKAVYDEAICRVEKRALDKGKFPRSPLPLPSPRGVEECSPK